MNCETALELIHAAAKGALEGPERETFDAHMAGCPACAAQLAFAKELVDLADSTPGVEVSADFSARVMGAIRSTKSSRIRTFHDKKSLKEVLGLFVPSTRFAVSLAIHAAVLLVAAFIFLKPAQMPEFDNVVLVTKPSHDDDYSRRVAAAKQSTTVSTTYTVDVSAFLVDGTMYIVDGGDSRHRFVYAYTKAEVALLPAEVRESAFPAQVAGGHVQLTESIFTASLGSARDVIVIALSDHFEIWNGADFAHYKLSAGSIG